MKIAYIGQKGIPAQFGGVERYVEEVAKRMAQKGHEIFVYARPNYTDKSLKEYQGIKIVSLPSIGTKNLDAISHTFLATIHALFQNYDAIHYHSIGPTSLSFIPKIFLPKTAIISTFQCQDYNHKKWGAFARWYLRFSEMLTCRIPDATISVSEGLKKYAQEKYGAETVLIPNGSATLDGLMSTQELQKRDIKKDEYILTVSRLVRHKGIHYLIEAFNELEEEGKTGGKKLVIVGDGFHTDDYVREIKTLAEGRKNIIFTGNLSGESLGQFFANAYIFVQPSEAEGLSLAILEAMGYGKAVLASDISENKEALQKTGFYFESKNQADLKKQLQFLFENSEQVSTKGEAAKKRAEENFSWDSIAGKIENLYQEIISQKKNAKK